MNKSASSTSNDSAAISTDCFRARLGFAKALVRWAGSSDARLNDSYEVFRRLNADAHEAPHTGQIVLKTGLYPQASTTKIAFMLRYFRAMQERPLRALQGLALSVLLSVALVWAVAISSYPYFNTRASDLLVIQRALEKYHADYGTYPTTGPIDGPQVFYGIGWNSDDPNWIPGLVPKYLDRMPIDPRKSNVPNAQYIYASNGASYKLLAMQPEDCEFTVLIRPWLRDPIRSAVTGACIAYGLHTPGAEHF
jgi:hypothetical protein